MGQNTMSEASTEEFEDQKTPSKLPLIIGAVAIVLGAAAGFFGTYTGLLIADESSPQEAEQSIDVMPLPDVAYVPIEPMVISFGSGPNLRHLRFTAQLEVGQDYQSDVERVLPRIVDVINGYLRALELGDLEDPLALIRFRAQLLQRIDIVTGRGRVNDLLIGEFVLN